MSERGDFFEAGAKALPPPASRGDFFSGKVDVSKPKAPKSFSAPYAYFDPELRRAAGLKEADLSPLAEIPPGFNRGVAMLAGIPGDAAQSLLDLSAATLGPIAAERVPSEPIATRPDVRMFDVDENGNLVPSRTFESRRIPDDLLIPDRAQIPFTGDWFARKLDETPLGPVTQIQDPSDPAHRFVYNLASQVPSAMTGARGSAVPAMTGSLAGVAAAEAGADPATQAGLSMLGGAAAARLTASPLTPSRAREVEPETPQQTLNRQASGQSMGAAGAAVDLQKLSPELRVAVERAVRQTGGAVNPEVLARQIQADSLPVKVRLSQGQALGDERLISLELNARGKHEAYSKGFAEQNKALVENLRALRDENGPDVFSTNPTEHADTIIARYKAIDDASRADITAKYKALEDANGGQFPVNGKTFVESADVALSKKMKTRYLPAEVRGDLDDFRDNAGMMTFEQFENLRTNLATAARSAERQGNGNAAAAINIVRRELESLPIEGDAAKLKPLADAARSAARARFDALDADPAYKAAVNETVTPDAFVQKYVVNGARDNVEKLSAAMAGDPAALQTLRVATLDHLRKSAGIDAGYNGNFTQAGFNKALQALEPKLLSLLDPKTAETARTLGDVARYTQFQPRGSFPNNSNTFVAAAAEKAADALEGVIDFKAGGIPFARTIRKSLNERKLEKAAEETFAPGAGLTKLSDLPKAGNKKP